ncbi:MAG: O-antigen ligase family protein [Candidatus Eremiobacteraeota bacterium]|nr:O-antigen ligase family protein [Candidatus Eremiobacteraeota bacterium]
MLPQHAIDPSHVRTPPGVLDVALYALVFVAVALVTRRRPAYGVAGLIAVVPFAFYRDLGHTTITLSKVALLGAIAGLALRGAGIDALRRPAASRIGLAGLLVVAATALSIAHAEFAEPALRETLKACEYVALFATVVVAARADPSERPIRIAFAASLALVALLALAQELGGAPSGLWFAGHAIPRIAGPLEGPNQLAGYLGLALPVVVAFLLRSPTRFERAAFAVGSAALVLTISRAGVAAGIVAIAIVAFRSPARGRRSTLTLGATGALAGLALLAFWGFAATHSLAGFDLLGRFSTLAEVAQPGSVGDRSQLWAAALVLWHRHPVFGIGAGNFEFELARAGFPGLRTHANSLYLQALAEGGIVSFAATLALVAVSIVSFARRSREPLVTAAFAASVGFALHQVFDLLVFFPKVGELWWILLGLAAARIDARE